MKSIYYSICFLFLVLLTISGCKKDDYSYYFDPENPLSIMQDTVKFDTLFTSLTSTTERIKIFNRSKENLTISEISLGGGDESFYQMNVSGISSSKITDFTIKGGDSVNLFVRVNIAATSAVIPFIVSDSITFVTNGKIQRLQLRAVGQNAHFINGVTIASNTTWDKTLPYVVYNALKVADGASLTIAKGSRVYFHKDASLEVAGTLKIEGDVTDTVTLASDRLETIYKEVPGQWKGIHFLPGSKDNVIQYATIKNALTGLQVDSVPVNANPKLLLANSIVKNMDVAGIVGYKTSIAGFNNLIANCKYLVYCTNGGEYNFKQNTFAFSPNYPYLVRTNPSVFFSDVISTTKAGSGKLTLINNIIWGGLDEEIQVEVKGSDFSATVRSNLIKSKAKTLGSADNIFNLDPAFIKSSEGNFKLTPSSPAANKGESLASDPYFQSYLSKDLKGRERLFPSDLGCYEIF